MRGGILKRINILDENTANKIAAGEVVDRPFSVVKELVENSIDSNASSITVEIEEGGEKLIKVIDNGTGIFPEDIKKAFLPHATSKISDIDDIYRIQTMGFRGEALASIASVSKVDMKSRTEDFDFGRNVTVEAGSIEGSEDVGANIGTTVVVRELFFNVPARKKFLKSMSREYSYISDIVARMAIANPEIAFKLIHNGKTSLTTFGTGEVIDAIRSVYGKTAADNLVKFEQHGDTASVFGFIGNAEIAKGNRNSQSIFVNKRYIKNRTISAAVENAFKSFITINKHPFFVLFINIYPEFIDVNVHPTKSEIKFKDEREIYKLVFSSVHTALRASLADTFMSEEEQPSGAEAATEVQAEKEIVQLPMDLNQPLSYPYSRSEGIFREQPEFKTPQYMVQEKDHVSSFAAQEKEESEPEPEPEPAIPEKAVSEIRAAKLPDLRVIGQFNKTYIIGEFKGELYLIDQHAAHEKILFEKYTDEIKKHHVIAQLLLSPEVVELSNEEYIIYGENTGLFENLGFNIEGFGQNTVCIREVPFILGKPDIKEFFISVLENLRRMGSGSTVEVKFNSIAGMACKAAVKARDNLSDIEMKALVEALKYIDDPYTCPHGRPTIIKIGLNELEKRFKRIQ
jgi:DNA mismatch repair protein MutL